MNKFRLKLLVLLLVLFPLVCNAGQTKYAIGFGAQFGGLAGLQISKQFDKDIIRASGSLLGYSIGYDRFVSPNISLGVQLFQLTVLEGAGLSMNYYVGSREKSNWVLGVDVGAGKVFDDFMGVSSEIEVVGFISMGYRF